MEDAFVFLKWRLTGMPESVGYGAGRNTRFCFTEDEPFVVSETLLRLKF